MKGLLIGAAMAALALAVPASAVEKSKTTRANRAKPPRAAHALMLSPAGLEHNRLECRLKWKLADRRGYGILYGRELRAARPLLPISLSNRDYVTDGDFLSACADTVSRNQSN